MGASPRTEYILLTSLVLVSLTALIIGLTVGLRTPAPANGGSPVDPVLPNITEPIEDPGPYDSITKHYSKAVVTTDTTPCSTIGVDMITAGGSAVDAVIAAAVCVGIVCHHNSGIGGGHFMVGYEIPRGGSQREFFSILAREWAPIDAHRDMFVNKTDASRKGGLAIGVPGEVKGFYEAWTRYGVLPWEDLFQPSIELCEDGYIVEQSLSSAIAQYEEDIRADPNLSELFVWPNNSLVKEGDTLTNPKLAVTLTKIAEDPHTFYNGTLANDIVADIAEYDGIIQLDDLSAYKAKPKDPLMVSLSNGEFTLYGARPPSSGAIFHFILNILNGYRFAPGDISDIDNKILTYHRILEAFKFAYAKRSELGDEDYEDVVELLANLTSVDYGEGIRAKVNDTSTQGWEYYEPAFDITPDHGTAHLAVQTREGSSVGLTATINLFFGSNVRGSRTGIMFNDEMDDFSTPGTENSFGVPASPANYIVPGKMPMSSMCPTLIADNNNNVVFMSGAAGGTQITTGTSCVTMNALWFNMTVKDASDVARLHHQLIPEEAEYEPHLEQEVLDGIRNKNHATKLDSSIGVVNSIQNTCNGDMLPTDKCMHVTADGRKGGVPDGADN